LLAALRAMSTARQRRRLTLIARQRITVRAVARAVARDFGQVEQQVTRKLGLTTRRFAWGVPASAGGEAGSTRDAKGRGYGGRPLPL
jgi:hypothetical protein